MKHFDAHTHRQSGEPEVFELLCVDPTSAAAAKPAPGVWISVGIHPWSADSAEKDAVADMRRMASGEMVAAVGEIGLDRSVGVDFASQLACFDAQCGIASDLRLPVIIHCVRSWSETLRMMKRHSKVPAWVFHGFHGNPSLAVQLLDSNAFLSFGAALLHPTPTVAESLRGTPTDRLLLETDDSGLSIRAVHAAAAEILGTDVDSLAGVLWDNARRIFKVK